MGRTLTNVSVMIGGGLCGVVALITRVTPVMMILSSVRFSPLVLAHPPGQFMATDSQLITFITILVTVSLIPSPMALRPVLFITTITMVSSWMISVSSSIPSLVTSTQPASLGRHLLEENSYGSKKNKQPHDFITVKFGCKLCCQLCLTIIMSFYIKSEINNNIS